MNKYLNLFTSLTKAKEMPENFSAQDYDIIFHIGAPKTGTSVIQNFLLKNRGLLQKNGYYYPKHDLDENNISSGQDIGNKIVEHPEEVQELIAQLLGEAKKKSCCLLISSESLYSTHKALRQITKSYKVGIIVYFRNPIDVIISTHNQTVKRHYATKSLQDFAADLLNFNNSRVSNTLFPRISGQILYDWEEQFTKPNLIVAPYNLSTYPRGKIEESILSILSITTANRKNFRYSSESINSSYTPETLELKRLLNQILDKNEQKVNNHIDILLQAYSDKITLKPKKNPKILLGELLHSKLIDTYMQKTDKLTQHFLSSYPSDILISHQSFNTKKNRQEFSSEWVLNQTLFKEGELTNIIKEKISQTLYKGNNINYELLKLADLFNIDIRRYKRLSLKIPEYLIKKIARPNMQKASILKDLAFYLESQGHNSQALGLIQQALELEPKEPSILKGYNRIFEKIYFTDPKPNKRKKCCILHIGLNKTGSTSIQHALYNNRDTLNVYYPICQLAKNHNVMLANLFKQNPENLSFYTKQNHSISNIEEYIQKSKTSLINQFNKTPHETFVFSAEMMIGFTQSELKIMIHYFSQLFEDIRIIGYIRPFSSYLCSHIQQSIKTGSLLKNLNQYIAYKKHLAIFFKLLPSKSITLIPYNRETLHKGCVVQDFCMRLGITLKYGETITQENQSLSIEATSVVYAINKYHPNIQHSYRIIFINILKTILPGKKFQLSKSTLKEVASIQEGDIKWIENKIGCSMNDIDDITFTQGAISCEDDLLMKAQEQIPHFIDIIKNQKIKNINDSEKVEILHILEQVTIHLKKIKAT